MTGDLSVRSSRSKYMLRVGSFIVFLYLLLSNTLFGQDGYPVPKVEKLLFYVQHNRGHNTFLYTLDFQADGHINRKNPVSVSRQLFDQDGTIKPLTPIQNRFAYGVKGKYVNTMRYEFTLAGYANQVFVLDLGEKVPRVKTVVNGRDLFLERMFLYQTEGSNGLNTSLDYILFFGRDSARRAVVEKLIP